MKRVVLLLAALFVASVSYAQTETAKWFDSHLPDSLDNKQELIRQLENLPNIEVGKGVTFRPKDNKYEMTLRFRMQNMVGLNFDGNFGHNSTEAQVKRLRLRFDGYIYSPEILYSIQLGYSKYDAEILPNGNMNIIRDAIVYYRPSAAWNIGLGQTKIKANRARVNSSSALQFVDRSIVNSEFNVDRDFGVFGEYNYGSYDNFALSTKASVTLGEGRNFAKSSVGGFAYTGRLELYPFGRFHSNGELVEGDFYNEDRVKVLLAGALSYNDNAMRVQGQKGSLLPSGVTKDITSYFVDFILKYKGFAFCADYMGRYTADPFFGTDGQDYIFTGSGLNLQTSYLFDGKWEIALRNSTIFADKRIAEFAEYSAFNQSTIGVTRYIIGHSVKLQFDLSYNHMENAVPGYDKWMMRFQIELGL